LATATTLSFAVKINFQPASASVPSGYLADGGSTYANRGNGYTYGWNTVNTSWTRDRNSSRSPDQSYDTFNHMQASGGGRSWQVAVPNGTYNVFVVAGDASNYDSVFRINVEGVLTVSGTPTSATRWLSGTRTVTVSDGRLTISNGSGASNNKICFIDISQSKSGMPAAPIVPLDTPLKLEWISRDADGKVTLRVQGTSGANCAIEASSNLRTWEALAVVINKNGTVSFDDPGSKNQMQRFYRARTD
jgi:hypothetical protein